MLGVYVSLVTLTFRRLNRRKNQHAINIAYSSVMLVLATAWFIANAKLSETKAIEDLYHRIENVDCSAVDVVAKVTSSAIVIGSDVLLVCQLFMIITSNLFSNSI
jgi:hypothetical protein